MYCRRLFFGGIIVVAALSAQAADTLVTSLPACREMALSAGVSAKAKKEALLAAEYNRKAALAAMFPTISANAGYMWNSKNLHFVSNEAAFSFGTANVAADGTASFHFNTNSALGNLQSQVAGTILETPVKNISADIEQHIADAYKYIYDAATVDITHVVVAQATVMQPIYLGGRLIQMYKIAQASENMAKIESQAKREETIYKVDEAYWRVVAVTQKKQLAEQYYSLLCKLENDVQEAVNEGLATQSDLLKVTTKRGDAQVKKLQAENGLTLSNMALAQVCGLPLSTSFVLDYSGLGHTDLADSHLDAASAVANRSEMQLMEQAQEIANRTAKLASAGLQPNIVAQASYMYTNPNADNGTSSNWDGTGFFSAGVIVNVPILHADDILRYKAAKHAAKVVELKAEETRELLTLQTTQANQKLMEAQQKIALAQLTQKNASEVLRMAQESFDAGMITASELMQAQTLWLSAETDLVDAQVEAKTTESQLRKYLGKL